VIVKVADVEPAGIVTLAGTTALGEFDEIVKAAPPGPAWPLSKTVPVADIPPRTEEGEMVNPLIEAGVIVRLAVFVVPARVAEMFANVAAVTPDVVTVNVAVLEPAATVTDAGTVAAALSEANATDIPPAGAAPLSVTVPIDGVPPRTLDSESDNPVN